MFAMFVLKIITYKKYKITIYLTNKIIFCVEVEETTKLNKFKMIN